MDGFRVSFLHQFVQLARQLEQRQVGHLIVVVCGDIVVLCLRDAHLVLQHIGYQVLQFLMALHPY